MKVFLDPSLFCFTDNSNYYEYLKEVTDFIDKYLDVNYLPSKEFSLQIIEATKIRGKSKTQNYAKIFLLKKIISKINPEKLEMNSTKSCILPSTFQVSNIDVIDSLQNSILSLVSYFCNGVLFFLAPKNFLNQPYTSGYLICISDIYREEKSYLSILIKEKKFIKENSFKKPTITDPLPNGDICKGYEELRKKTLNKGLSQQQLRAKWKDISPDVAYRNFYKEDPDVTRLNPKRDIFSNKDKDAIYLSTDLCHGCFEVCNKRGKHQGEFSFDGIRTEEKDDTTYHDINV